MKSVKMVNPNRDNPNRKMSAEGKRGKLKAETPKMQRTAIANRDFL
jgi:hypothetical protein